MPDVSGVVAEFQSYNVPSGRAQLIACHAIMIGEEFALAKVMQAVQIADLVSELEGYGMSYGRAHLQIARLVLVGSEAAKFRAAQLRVVGGIG